MSCSDKDANKISRTTESKLIQWARDYCQVSTRCKTVDKIQSKNKDVKLGCISYNFLHKTQMMSCFFDKNNNILSTKSGKVKELINWVQNNECKIGDDLSRKVIKNQCRTLFFVVLNLITILQAVNDLSDLKVNLVQVKKFLILKS